MVIVIICVLAGLLLPALGQGKRRAQQIACVNHFKQLTASWKIYADDSHGKLVPVFYFFRGQVNFNAWVRGSMDDDITVYPPVQPGIRDSTNLAGIELGSLFHYCQTAAIYRCLADPSTTDGVRLVRSYSLNGWMGGHLGQRAEQLHGLAAGTRHRAPATVRSLGVP